MLNTELLDEKDKRILQLENMIKSFKKYDEEQKAYRHSLEKENQDLRYRVDDLEAEMSEISKDPSLQALQDRYTKLVEQQKRLTEDAKRQVSAYSRKIQLASHPELLQEIIDDLTTDQLKLGASVVELQKQNREVRERERHIKLRLHDYIASCNAKGMIESEKIEELMKLQKLF